MCTNLMNNEDFVTVDGVQVVTSQMFWNQIICMSGTTDRVRTIAKVAAAVAFVSLALNIVIGVLVLQYCI